MQDITFDVEAGRVSAELELRGIEAERRVRVTVQVPESAEDSLPLEAANQAGGAFDWLDDEPDLYSDADLIGPAR